jgi:hypothetical protein
LNRRLYDLMRDLSPRYDAPDNTGNGNDSGDNEQPPKQPDDASQHEGCDHDSENDA